MCYCEQAICSICWELKIVDRKYYRYAIECECCWWWKHFEIVRYCKDCEPKPPTSIKANVIPLPS